MAMKNEANVIYSCINISMVRLKKILIEKEISVENSFLSHIRILTNTWWAQDVFGGEAGVMLPVYLAIE
jgi:hypothetical protein